MFFINVTDPNFSWTVGFKEFAHPATETFSTIAQAGPTFFLAIAMFGFVFQISALVAEKELKLRQVQTSLTTVCLHIFMLKVSPNFDIFAGYVYHGAL